MSRVSVDIVRQGNYETAQVKQQCNNVNSFPVYVLANKEVGNYYECSKCGAGIWNMNLVFLHRNDSFALLGKVYLKIRRHAYECLLYCSKLTTSEDLAQYSLLHDSIHYSVVFICLVNPTRDS